MRQRGARKVVVRSYGACEVASSDWARAESSWGLHRMETKDAWILLAGTMLGFVASLLATFTAPSIGSAFDRLKSGFIERNKARALFSYAEVLALKNWQGRQVSVRDQQLGFCCYLHAVVCHGSHRRIANQ